MVKGKFNHSQHHCWSLLSIKQCWPVSLTVLTCLPWNANLSQWRNLPDQCKLCVKRQTLSHSLNSSSVALHSRRYNQQHNLVLSTIHDFLLLMMTTQLCQTWVSHRATCMYVCMLYVSRLFSYQYSSFTLKCFCFWSSGCLVSAHNILLQIHI